MERLRSELGGAKHEAGALATAIWARHYREQSPQFELGDTVAGIISQIDNMAAGLMEQLSTALARVEALEGLGELLANVRRHRNVPCSESRKCPGEACGVVAHNHIIYETREARDDADALFDAIDAALEREG